MAGQCWTIKGHPKSTSTRVTGLVKPVSYSCPAVPLRCKNRVAVGVKRAAACLHRLSRGVIRCLLQIGSHSVSAPDWYALQVRPQHECIVPALLKDRGYEILVPLYRSRRTWSDRTAPPARRPYRHDANLKPREGRPFRPLIGPSRDRSSRRHSAAS